ncbi:MAG TPA: hypothetical protein VLE95_07440 [Chlamydiales bacterium]|nr:hypothetical protein [Chlamydiales bacterium]
MKKKAESMIQHLVKHGKNSAVVLTDQVLEAAGLSKSVKIQLIVNPSGGLLLQSVEDSGTADALATFKKVKRKHSRLFRRPAKR